jgi:hypothetical protein
MSKDFFPAQEKLIKSLEELETANYSQDAMGKVYQALDEAVQENQQLQESIKETTNTKSNQERRVTKNNDTLFRAL